MKNNVKIIFHIDLNAFFASCAMIKDPYLKDKAFVVGGSQTMRRGVVTTASYEARKYGIHSAMNINDALRLYPKLIVVPTQFPLYQKYSNLFFQFLKRYSPLVLAGSIDEAYVDVTELAEKKHPLTLAKEMQDQLLKEYKLPSSIGVAPTLFLAKMASDLKKPLGISVIRKKDIVNILFPMPISSMFGIGRKTYPKLEAYGIKTIGDFTKSEYKESILKVMSEQSYESFIDHMMGRSSDIVDPKKYMIPQSISNETTLNYAMDQAEAIFSIIKDLYDRTIERLVNEECVAKTVGLKFRTTDFESFSRGVSVSDYSDDYHTFYEKIENLFEHHYKGQPLRLVGVYFNQIILKKDLKTDINLFNYMEFTKREEELYKQKK